MKSQVCIRHLPLATVSCRWMQQRDTSFLFLKRNSVCPRYWCGNISSTSNSSSTSSCAFPSIQKLQQDLNTRFVFSLEGYPSFSRRDSNPKKKDSSSLRVVLPFAAPNNTPPSTPGGNTFSSLGAGCCCSSSSSPSRLCSSAGGNTPSSTPTPCPSSSSCSSRLSSLSAGVNTFLSSLVASLPSSSPSRLSSSADRNTNSCTQTAFLSCSSPYSSRSFSSSSSSCNFKSPSSSPSSSSSTSSSSSRNSDQSNDSGRHSPLQTGTVEDLCGADFYAGACLPSPFRRKEKAATFSLTSSDYTTSPISSPSSLSPPSSLSSSCSVSSSVDFSSVLSSTPSCTTSSSLHLSSVPSSSPSSCSSTSPSSSVPSSSSSSTSPSPASMSLSAKSFRSSNSCSSSSPLSCSSPSFKTRLSPISSLPETVERMRRIDIDSAAWQREAEAEQHFDKEGWHVYVSSTRTPTAHILHRQSPLHIHSASIQTHPSADTHEKQITNTEVSSVIGELPSVVGREKTERAQSVERSSPADIKTESASTVLKDGATKVEPGYTEREVSSAIIQDGEPLYTRKGMILSCTGEEVQQEEGRAGEYAEWRSSLEARRRLSKRRRGRLLQKQEETGKEEELSRRIHGNKNHDVITNKTVGRGGEEAKVDEEISTRDVTWSRNRRKLKVVTILNSCQQKQGYEEIAWSEETGAGDTFAAAGRDTRIVAVQEECEGLRTTATAGNSQGIATDKEDGQSGQGETRQPRTAEADNMKKCELGYMYSVLSSSHDRKKTDTRYNKRTMTDECKSNTTVDSSYRKSHDVEASRSRSSSSYISSKSRGLRSSSSSSMGRYSSQNDDTFLQRKTNKNNNIFVSNSSSSDRQIQHSSSSTSSIKTSAASEQHTENNKTSKMFYVVNNRAAGIRQESCGLAALDIPPPPLTYFDVMNKLEGDSLNTEEATGITTEHGGERYLGAERDIKNDSGGQIQRMTSERKTSVDQFFPALPKPRALSSFFTEGRNDWRFHLTREDDMWSSVSSSTSEHLQHQHYDTPWTPLAPFRANQALSVSYSAAGYKEKDTESTSTTTSVAVSQGKSLNRIGPVLLSKEYSSISPPLRHSQSKSNNTQSDKHLRVFVQSLNRWKPIGLLSAQQLLHVMQHPAVSLGYSQSHYNLPSGIELQHRNLFPLHHEKSYPLSSALSGELLRDNKHQQLQRSLLPFSATNSALSAAHTTTTTPTTTTTTTPTISSSPYTSLSSLPLLSSSFERKNLFPLWYLRELLQRLQRIAFSFDTSSFLAIISALYVHLMHLRAAILHTQSVLNFRLQVYNHVSEQAIALELAARKAEEDTEADTTEKTETEILKTSTLKGTYMSSIARAAAKARTAAEAARKTVQEEQTLLNQLENQNDNMITCYFNIAQQPLWKCLGENLLPHLPFLSILDLTALAEVFTAAGPEHTNITSVIALQAMDKLQQLHLETRRALRQQQLQSNAAAAVASPVASTAHSTADTAAALSSVLTNFCVKSSSFRTEPIAGPTPTIVDTNRHSKQLDISVLLHLLDVFSEGAYAAAGVSISPWCLPGDANSFSSCSNFSHLSSAYHAVSASTAEANEEETEVNEEAGSTTQLFAQQLFSRIVSLLQLHDTPSPGNLSLLTKSQQLRLVVHAALHWSHLPLSCRVYVHRVLEALIFPVSIHPEAPSTDTFLAPSETFVLLAAAAPISLRSPAAPTLPLHRFLLLPQEHFHQQQQQQQQQQNFQPQQQHPELHHDSQHHEQQQQQRMPEGCNPLHHQLHQESYGQYYGALSAYQFRRIIPQADSSEQQGFLASLYSLSSSLDVPLPPGVERFLLRESPMDLFSGKGRLLDNLGDNTDQSILPSTQNIASLHPSQQPISSPFSSSSSVSHSSSSCELKALATHETEEITSPYYNETTMSLLSLLESLPMKTWMSSTGNSSSLPHTSSSSSSCAVSSPSRASSLLSLNQLNALLDGSTCSCPVVLSPSNSFLSFFTHNRYLRFSLPLSRSSGFDYYQGENPVTDSTVDTCPSFTEEKRFAESPAARLCYSSQCTYTPPSTLTDWWISLPVMSSGAPTSCASTPAKTSGEKREDFMSSIYLSRSSSQENESSVKSSLRGYLCPTDTHHITTRTDQECIHPFTLGEAESRFSYLQDVLDPASSSKSSAESGVKKEFDVLSCTRRFPLTLLLTLQRSLSRFTLLLGDMQVPAKATAATAAATSGNTLSTTTITAAGVMKGEENLAISRSANMQEAKLTSTGTAAGKDCVASSVGTRSDMAIPRASQGVEEPNEEKEKAKDGKEQQDMFAEAGETQRRTEEAYANDDTHLYVNDHFEGSDVRDNSGTRHTTGSLDRKNKSNTTQDDNYSRNVNVATQSKTSTAPDDRKESGMWGGQISNSSCKITHSNNRCSIYNHSDPDNIEKKNLVNVQINSCRLLSLLAYRICSQLPLNASSTSFILHTLHSHVDAMLLAVALYSERRYNSIREEKHTSTQLYEMSADKEGKEEDDGQLSLSIAKQYISSSVREQINVCDAQETQGLLKQQQHEQQQQRLERQEQQQQQNKQQSQLQDDELHVCRKYKETHDNCLIKESTDGQTPMNLFSCGSTHSAVCSKTANIHENQKEAPRCEEKGSQQGYNLASSPFIQRDMTITLTPADSTDHLRKEVSKGDTPFSRGQSMTESTDRNKSCNTKDVWKERISCLATSDPMKNSSNSAAVCGTGRGCPDDVLEEATACFAIHLYSISFLLRHLTVQVRERGTAAERLQNSDSMSSHSRESNSLRSLSTLITALSATEREGNTRQIKTEEDSRAATTEKTRSHIYQQLHPAMTQQQQLYKDNSAYTQFFTDPFPIKTSSSADTAWEYLLPSNLEFLLSSVLRTSEALLITENKRTPARAKQVEAAKVVFYAGALECLRTLRRLCADDNLSTTMQFQMLCPVYVHQQLFLPEMTIMFEDDLLQCRMSSIVYLRRTLLPGFGAFYCYFPYFAALRETTVWLFLLGSCAKEKLLQSSQLTAAAAVDMRAILSLFESLGLLSQHLILLDISQETALLEGEQGAVLFSEKEKENKQILSIAFSRVGEGGSRTFSRSGGKENVGACAEASGERDCSKATSVNSQVEEEVILQTAVRDAADNLKELVALIVSALTNWLPYTEVQHQARVQRAVNFFTEAHTRWVARDSGTEKTLSGELFPRKIDSQQRKADDGLRALTRVCDEKTASLEHIHSQPFREQNESRRNRIYHLPFEELPRSTRVLYAVTQAVLMNVPTRKLIAALGRVKKLEKRYDATCKFPPTGLPCSP